MSPDLDQAQGESIAQRRENELSQQNMQSKEVSAKPRTWSKRQKYPQQAVFNSQNGMKENKYASPARRDFDRHQDRLLRLHKDCHRLVENQSGLTKLSTTSVENDVGFFLSEMDRAMETIMIKQHPDLGRLWMLLYDDWLGWCQYDSVGAIDDACQMLLHAFRNNWIAAMTGPIPDLDKHLYSGTHREIYLSVFRLAGRNIPHFMDYGARGLCSTSLKGYLDSLNSWLNALVGVLKYLSIQNQDQSGLMLAIIDEAFETIRAFHEDASFLSHLWTSYELRLTQYRAEIQKVKDGTTQWHELNLDFSDIEHDPQWQYYRAKFEESHPYLFQDQNQDPFEQSTSSMNDGNDNDNDNELLPPKRQALNDTLQLWSYLGRAIATSFDEYFKVSKILSLVSLPMSIRKVWGTCWDGWTKVFDYRCSNVCGFEVFTN